jgi:hypothetical protein
LLKKALSPQFFDRASAPAVRKGSPGRLRRPKASWPRRRISWPRPQLAMGDRIVWLCD